MNEQKQHRLMKRETNLLEVLEDATNKMDKGEPVDMVYVEGFQ